MKSRIDLRSDTVTLPTAAMRKAMAEAEVGDDVYGEDPTVKRLEAMAAERLGKEAALFVPSGTMGNLAAILVHCGRGDEVILGDLSHTYLFEAGGASALGGVHTMTVANKSDGTMDPDEIEAAIRTDNPHYPVTRLICLENTHNVCGGAPLSESYTRQVGELARSRGIRLHIDGARIFNASVALDISPAALAGPADSITFCLSKGLSAPVGSMLCGDQTFIAAALRVRKMLGGGMRQVGVVAAAGIVALETMTRRLALDHEHAQALADFLDGLPGIVLDKREPPTNMLFFRLNDAAAVGEAELVQGMADRGVILSPGRAGRFRLVTHADIDDDDLEHVKRAFGEMLRAEA